MAPKAAKTRGYCKCGSRQRADGSCSTTTCECHRAASRGKWLKLAKVSPKRKQPKPPSPVLPPRRVPVEPALEPARPKAAQPQPPLSRDYFLVEGAPANLKVVRAYLFDPKVFGEAKALLGISAAHGVLSCMHRFLDSCCQTPGGKLTDVVAVLLSVAISLAAPDSVPGVRGNSDSWRGHYKNKVGSLDEFRRIETEWLCLLPASQRAIASMVTEGVNDASSDM